MLIAEIIFFYISRDSNPKGRDPPGKSRGALDLSFLEAVSRLGSILLDLGDCTGI